MNYPVQIEGCEGQVLQVQPSAFGRDPKLFVNGRPAPSGPGRRQMLLHRNDGKTMLATWKPRFLGLDVPQLVVDGRLINVIDPLKWYEWMWSGLPILLIFYGGMLGAIFGFFGFAMNMKIFRSDLNGLTKYFLTGCLSVIVVAVYLGMALFILALVHM